MPGRWVDLEGTPGLVMRDDKRAGTASRVRYVLAVYALSRAFYLIAGSMLARVVPTASFQRLTLDVPAGSMSIWSHWDGEQYVGLALRGYLQPPSNVSPAFFPMYPLLIRSFSELFGGPLTKDALSLWGPLVSLLFLPCALYFIYDMAFQEWGKAVADRSVLTLAFFPTAFFLNAAYTESLFLAVSAGSLWAIRVRRNLLLACVLAGCAAATRNIGVFLAVPILIEWIKAGGLAERRTRWRGVYLALAPSGLIVYMGYLWVTFGDPLLFYSEQKNWGRQAAGPLTTAVRAWQLGVDGAARLGDARLWAHPSLRNLADHLTEAHCAYELALFVLGVVVLLAGVRKLPLSLTIYGFLLVVPVTLFGTPESPLLSAPRYVLAAFPIFMGLGLMLRTRLLLSVWLILSAGMSLVLCGLFVSWRYVA